MKWLHISETQGSCFLLWNIDIHPKQGRGKRLALGVSHQAERAAAAERFVKQEIEGLEIRKLKPLYTSFDHFAKMGLYPFGGNFTNQERIEFIAQCDHAHVCCITLIAGTCMGEF